MPTVFSVLPYDQLTCCHVIPQLTIHVTHQIWVLQAFHPTVKRYITIPNPHGGELLNVNQNHDQIVITQPFPSRHFVVMHEIHVKANQARTSRSIIRPYPRQ